MVPDDVGGRYSVLTAVGLLPIAVAGVDITALMQGRRRCMETLHRSFLPVPCLAVRRRPVRAVPGGPVH